MIHRIYAKAWLIAVVTIAFGAPAFAQSGGIVSEFAGGDLSGRIVQLVVLVSVLSVAPGLLVMVTSFTRFAIALSFLRSGLGLQNTPGNMVLVSLSLFLTLFVMGPTFEKSWSDGVRPMLEKKISEEEAALRIVAPFREFMIANVREADLRVLRDLQQRKSQQSSTETPPLTLLMPAFMMSELRRGFEIGFLIALPFLVIDLIVATIVMSMGMMMLPPSAIGLPVKVLFFVLIDGWSLLVSGLVRSFA